MDNRRIFLIIIFAFSLYMLWAAWEQQNAPPPQPTLSTQTDSQNTAHQDIPSASGNLRPDDSVPKQTEDTRIQAPTMMVKTDYITAEISAQGGSIIGLTLNEQKVSIKDPRPFVLLDSGKIHTYVADSGLLGKDMPNHRTLFSLPQKEISMADGQDTLTVRLDAPEQNGIQVSKILTFHKSSYIINVGYEIHNNQQQAIKPDAYFQFTRDGEPAEEHHMFGVNTFTGPAVYTDEEKYQKVQFSDIDKNKAKFSQKANNGWIAMVQHYFVGAWIPPTGMTHENYIRKLPNNLYQAGVIIPVPVVEPGQTISTSIELYAGPQDQHRLATITQGLELAVDYGWLTVIAAPLFWLLSWFHKLTGNWGWSIILLTVLIKLIFFPLSAASYKSMAKMRVLGPRMKKLKELYGQDKARLQQEMMQMYKREKINPLGGCLPIVVQIPVFISLYWVLLGSVEMRQAPWLGWILDLSSKDPYFILPIIMGISMLVQMRLNPTPPDPMQAKVMMIMPIVFTFMFLWFPSGLVLYWTVNNLLSIAQQWQITRMIERGKKSLPANN